MRDLKIANIVEILYNNAYDCIHRQATVMETHNVYTKTVVRMNNFIYIDIRQGIEGIIKIKKG